MLSLSLSRSKTTLITSKRVGICNSLVSAGINAKTVPPSIPVAQGIGVPNVPSLRIVVIRYRFVRRTQLSIK